VSNRKKAPARRWKQKRQAAVVARPVFALPGAGFVTLTTVLQFLNVSRKTLRAMIARGYFPAPDMLIGGRWPRWSVQTLQRFESKPPKTMPPLEVRASLSEARR